MFFQRISVCASIAFASSMMFPQIAGAQTTNSSSGAASVPATMHAIANVPCERADAAMMSGKDQVQPPLASSSGGLDTDFATMMDFHHDLMMAMAELESRCGKVPKIRDAARRFVQNAPRTHRFSGASE